MAKYIIYKGLNPKYYTKKRKIKTPKKPPKKNHQHPQKVVPLNNSSSKNQHHQQWTIKHPIMVLLQDAQHRPPLKFRPIRGDITTA